MAWQLQIRTNAKGIIDPAGTWKPIVEDNGNPAPTFGTRAEAEAYLASHPRFAGTRHHEQTKSARLIRAGETP